MGILIYTTGQNTQKTSFLKILVSAISSRWAFQDLMLGIKRSTKKEKKQGNGFPAYNSLYTKCYAASNGSTEKIDFFFMQYLRFVDAGVGKYQHYKGTKKAQFNKELSPWGTSKRKKRVQRPFLNIEIRHQITRLRRIAIRYYQHDIGGVFGLLISEKK